MNIAPPRILPTIEDLEPHRQLLLKHYAEGCRARVLAQRYRLDGQWVPNLSPDFVKNCMEDALRAIHNSRESWERIESAVKMDAMNTYL